MWQVSDKSKYVKIWKSSSCSFWTSSPQICEKSCDVAMWRKVSLFLSLKGRGAASTATWPQPEHGATNATNRRIGKTSGLCFCITFCTKSTFENKIVHILISPVFFTVSTSKIMTGCFRSEFFCRFCGLTVLGVSFEEALPWKLSLVANRPSLGITTEGLRLRTVRRNDFSWKSQDCYKDIEYLHKIWISRSKIRVQMLIHLFTIFA